MRPSPELLASPAPGPRRLPQIRGPLTRWLFRRLRGEPTVAEPPAPPEQPERLLVDDDFQMALHCLHDLEYRPVDELEPAATRDPLVRDLHERLDDAFLVAVVDDARAEADRWLPPADEQGPGPAVDAMLAAFEGPSLSSFLAERGERWQLQEFLIHRSAYQLKEADPHTAGLARLAPGPRKRAFVEIQLDEYGGGVAGLAHAERFARAMAHAALDPAYGHYLDDLGGPTLATDNLLMSFARRRELLAPLVGHLALFEMTSVTPMGRYARAVTRLGFDAEVRAFFDVHVTADTHHGMLARTQLLGDEPGGGGDGLDPAAVAFGALALLRAEDRFARSLLDAWAAGRSSLRPGHPSWAPLVRPPVGGPSPRPGRAAGTPGSGVGARR